MGTFRRMQGETHPRTILSSHEVVLVRQLRQEGMQYKELAEKFEVSKRTIAAICRFKRRCYG